MNRDEVVELLDIVSRFDVEVVLINKHIDSLDRMRYLYDTTQEIRCLEDRIKEIARKKAAVSRAIDRLEDQIARMVFTSKYMLGNTWKETAAYCGKMSSRNAVYIKTANFDKFVKILNEELDKE